MLASFGTFGCPENGAVPPSPCEEPKIKIIRGEKAINNLRRASTVREPIALRFETETTIQYRGRQRLIPYSPRQDRVVRSPVAAIFKVPRTRKVVPIATGLRQNGVGGVFKINVTAAFHGQTGATVITQTNVAAGVRGGGFVCSPAGLPR